MDRQALEYKALAKIELQRRQGLKDLYYFNKHILGYSLMDEVPHREMCDSVQHGGPRQLHLWPRGHFKSSCITIGYALWRIVQDPDIRILIANATLVNAKAFLREIKGHIEKNERFQLCYGDFLNSDKWTEVDVIVKGRTKNLKEPTIMVAGVGQSLTGLHFDLILGDDLVNYDLVNTPEQIAKTLRWWGDAISLLDPEGQIIAIGTRYHFNDLYSHIIDNMSEEYRPQVHSALLPTGEPLFPKRFSKEKLNSIKAEQGSWMFCNPGEAPILMSDWSVKRIDEVRVGDEVIGFEIGRGVLKNKLVKTRVLAVSLRQAEVQRVYLESGRTIRCTPDHYWYTGRSNGDGSHKAYKPVKVGGRLMQVVNTDYNKELERDFSYLAGMIDGEGACKYGSIAIHQSAEANPEVFNKIEATLASLKLPYKHYRREHTGKYAGKFGDSFVINGGRQSKFDILRYGNPAKAGQICQTLWDRPSGAVRLRDKVLRIQPLGKETVYGLSTETKNYVAWGYASKNSMQYLNSPIDDENAKFKLSMFKYEDTLPNKSYYTTMCIDRSYSLAKTADYTAFTVRKLDGEGYWRIVLALRMRATEGEIINKIFDYKEHFKVDKVGVEQLAFNDTLKPVLEEEMRRRGSFFTVEELKGRTSKISRIEGLIPRFESGTIIFTGNRKDFADLEDELLRFPLSQFDDLADSLAYHNDMSGRPVDRMYQEVKQIINQRLDEPAY